MTDEVSKQAIKARFIKLANELMRKHSVRREKDFCESIQISPSQWSNIKASDDKYISSEIISTTLLVYKECNAQWIMIGEGEMFNDDTKLPNKPKDNGLYGTEVIEFLREQIKEKDYQIRLLLEKLGKRKVYSYQSASELEVTEKLLNEAQEILNTETA